MLIIRTRSIIRRIIYLPPLYMHLLRILFECVPSLSLAISIRKHTPGFVVDKACIRYAFPFYIYYVSGFSNFSLCKYGIVYSDAEYDFQTYAP